MANTGNKLYSTLQQYNLVTGASTGTTKPNTVGDPDYVPPAYDPIACPPPPSVPLTNNKVQLQVENQGSQFINYPALLIKPWNATLPSQNYYNGSLSIIPGGTQSYINTPIAQIADWITLQVSSGSFSKGWRTAVSVYFTNSTGRTLKDQFQLDPNSGTTRNYIPVPRTGVDNVNLIEVIITDIPDVPPTPNVPPTAEAGPNQTIAYPTNEVTLAGSGTDPDGTIVGYSWIKKSGPLSYTFSDANIANPIVANLVPGIYVFELTVTDNNGAIGKDTVTITMQTAPDNPNGIIVAMVDSALTSSTITHIIVTGDSIEDPIDLLELDGPITSSDGPQSYSFPKGTFDVEVVTTGAGGSIRISSAGNPVVCQNYAGAGSYVFNNMVVDEGTNGLTISLTSGTCSDQPPAVYAQLTVSNIQTIEEALAPWGKRVRSIADIIVKFYSDSGGTIPVSVNLVLNYRITTLDNLTSTTGYTNNYTGVENQDSISIGTDLTLQEWDYTSNDPDVAEDPADKYVDDEYTYSLLPGVGYIIIP